MKNRSTFTLISMILFIIAGKMADYYLSPDITRYDIYIVAILYTVVSTRAIQQYPYER